jgi:hypothetical protein
MTVYSVPNMPPNKDFFLWWSVKNTFPRNLTGISQQCLGTSQVGHLIDFKKDGVWLFFDQADSTISKLSNKWVCSLCIRYWHHTDAVNLRGGVFLMLLLASLVDEYISGH